MPPPPPPRCRQAAAAADVLPPLKQPTLLFAEGVAGGEHIPREEVAEAVMPLVASVAEEAMVNCHNNNTMIDCCSFTIHAALPSFDLLQDWFLTRDPEFHLSRR
jgi:hypothetical protein